VLDLVAMNIAMAGGVTPLFGTGNQSYFCRHFALARIMPWTGNEMPAGIVGAAGTYIVAFVLVESGRLGQSVYSRR
jgi:hypothetical protein